MSGHEQYYWTLLILLLLMTIRMIMVANDPIYYSTLFMPVTVKYDYSMIYYYKLYSNDEEKSAMKYDVTIGSVLILLVVTLTWLLNVLLAIDIPTWSSRNDVLANLTQYVYWYKRQWPVNSYWN